MGMVFLIGAGPGDPGMLTLRGKEVLEEADVVVYDYLADPALLAMAKPDAEVIYVGKKAEVHALPQQEINQLLVEKARQGKNVARLKGGDPYIFGRGGEEAEALLDAGVSFEEIPGISSTIAGPACAGICLTHRDFSSSVTLITGHERPDREKSAHNWQALAASANTLVFVMGMKNLPMISTKLIDSGMNPQTPAAVIHWACTPRQRTLVSTLEKIPAEAESAGLTNPSLIVVGKVVQLHERLNWFEKRPLFGRTVLVTRSREQNSELAAQFKKLGAEVIQFPSIEVRPLAEYSEVDAVLHTLPKNHWVIFTSANGVKFFWDRLENAGLDARAFGSAKIAAIGPGTALSLKKHGIKPDFMPESYIAESVAEGLLKIAHMQGQKILIPRAKKARDVLPEKLSAAGAEVHVLPVYETVAATGKESDVLESLESKRLFCITFTASSTVRHFFDRIDPQIIKAHPEVRLACIGPVTAETLERYGLKAEIIPKSYTIPALVSAVATSSEEDRI